MAKFIIEGTPEEIADTVLMLGANVLEGVEMDDNANECERITCDCKNSVLSQSTFIGLTEHENALLSDILKKIRQCH